MSTVVRLGGFCLAISFAAAVISFAQAPGAEPALAPSSSEELRWGELRVGKILFLGNSITLHGPKADIGWTGEWGMAASARDKDYVHRLLMRIARQAGGEPKSMVRNIADFERRLDEFDVRETLRKELEFEADVVILAIGENAAPPKTPEENQRMARALAGLLAEIKRHGQPKIFVRSQFWADPVKDALLKQACQDAGGTFVDIGALGREAGNFARAERTIEHAGVAAHPGDRGMEALAAALGDALQAAARKK